MNTKTALAAAMLTLSTVAGTAGAGPGVEPQTTSGWFASRIVGAYQSEAHVRVCGSPGPDEVVNNTIVFNAGGTVIAIPRFPPQGADNYSRTNDLRSEEHTSELQSLPNLVCRLLLEIGRASCRERV